MARGPNGGGELKIFAATLEQPVIEEIVTPLGLQVWASLRPLAGLQLRSNRSRFITFVQAAAKSRTKAPCASLLA